MPLIATRGNAAAGGYGWSLGVSESLDGMVLMTPTSVTAVGTGSSATINANGSVAFSTCTSLSVDGVFTADYDNYMIVLGHTTSSSDAQLQFALRSGGVSNATANSYTNQEVFISGNLEFAARDVRDFGRISYQSSTVRNGYIVYVYGPYLAQPTALRSVTMDGVSSARISDHASTHNQSTSYDGIMFGNGLNMDGLISVYGLEN